MVTDSLNLTTFQVQLIWQIKTKLTIKVELYIFSYHDDIVIMNSFDDDNLVVEV